MVTARERRTITASVAVLLMGWGLAKGGPSYLERLQVRRTAAQLLSLRAAHHERLLRDSARAELAYEGLRARREALADRALQDCEPAVCVDEAQAELEESLLELPLSVLEVTGAADSTRVGRLSRIRLDVLLESDASGLEKVLPELRRHRLRLDLAELRIEASDPGSTTGPERLRIQMQLHAWAQQ